MVVEKEKEEEATVLMVCQNMEESKEKLWYLETQVAAIICVEKNHYFLIWMKALEVLYDLEMTL